VSELLAARDDGPLARRLAPLGRTLPPSGLVLLAVAEPLLVLLRSDAKPSHGLIGAAVLWLVVLGGAARGGDLERDRFAWLVPGLLRAGEYALLLWISSAGCSEGPAAGFALLVVLAFHHYDLVYRPRHQGAAPPAWLGLAAGGWDGRLVLAWLLLAANALPAGLYVLAAVLAVLFVGESIASWRGHGPFPVLDPEGDAG
jgi:hypothetical protein